MLSDDKDDDNDDDARFRGGKGWKSSLHWKRLEMFWVGQAKASATLYFFEGKFLQRAGYISLMKMKYLATL